MMLLLSRAHYPVNVLGPGRRAGIWFQGCGIGCRGCLSRDTWSFDEGSRVEVEDVLDWCRGLPSDGVDGITISGGEPFDQPEALDALLRGLRSWRGDLGRPVDLLCYSGRSLSVLERNYHDILRLCDALIPEPFLDHQPDGVLWRGSANQPVVCLSELGRSRYSSVPVDGSDRRRFQVEVDGEKIWYIGIPRRGDMERLYLEAQERGLVQEGVSWKA